MFIKLQGIQRHSIIVSYPDNMADKQTGKQKVKVRHVLAESKWHQQTAG